MIKYDIYIHSTSEHISQLCTGFSMLAAQNKIKLTCNLQPYTRDGKSPLKDKDPYALQGMFVVVNDKTTVYYDTTDGENFPEEAMIAADIYFKRSYRSEAIPDAYKKKVYPLGLNYELYPGGINKLDIARFFLNKHVSKSPKHMAKSLLRNLHLTYQPSVADMHSTPDPSREPKVLFMTRAWDPDGFPDKASPEVAEYWKRACNEVNETRALIIGTLREKLGDRFYGGFSHDEYSARNYKQFLLTDARMSKKKAYINILKEFPICIASTGLFNSIGWKLAEYVAFSKAIVSEPLYFEVPGNFEKDKNYLEFITAEQCVKQTLLLLNDQQKRAEIMENNNRYYNEYLSPDKLIWRTLEIAAG
ncbi:MAG TPA: hypothetical protein VIM89_18030 [Mucilaginibacter sp.]